MAIFKSNILVGLTFWEKTPPYFDIQILIKLLKAISVLPVVAASDANLETNIAQCRTRVILFYT